MCLKNTRLLIHYFFLSVLRADQNHPVGSVESVQRWNNNLGSSPACFRAFFHMSSVIVPLGKMNHLSDLLYVKDFFSIMKTNLRLDANTLPEYGDYELCSYCASWK